MSKPGVIGGRTGVEAHLAKGEWNGRKEDKNPINSINY
jgi:hypothetical protein